MGIKPEDEERAVFAGGIAGHAGNAAHGKAVVAAENQRKTAGGGHVVDATFEGAREGADDPQIVGLRVVRQIHRRHDPEIADIGDVMAKLDQRLVDAGNA